MEQTLQALGGILLNAIPTLVLVLLLHFFLRRMLFQPLERVLAQRDEETLGARRAAEDSLRRAERRAAEYETAIRDARGEVFREHETARAQMLADQKQHLLEARAQSEQLIRQSREELQAETETARRTLEESTGMLADQIADSVLGRRAA